MNRTSFQIAIDGPVAAGKSTVARRLAERLGFLYVDTGAMYRAVTLLALDKGVRTDDESALLKLISKTTISVRLPRSDEDDGRQSTVLIDDKDVSWSIRKSRVDRAVAVVASLPAVRQALVPVQQKVAMDQDVVMEGRDITYVVLPQADLKIFLDAAIEVRQERYYKIRKVSRPDLTREEAIIWLRERDATDKNRAASPLKIVEGVWHFDTSELTLKEVVDTIADRVATMRQTD